jgi:hypothetical protein
MTGYTTVVFYNRMKQFTAADVQSGALRVWMEETYLWWSQLNPCSTNQATSTAAQNTATNTASSAAAAAASTSNTGTNGTSTNSTSTNTNTNSSSENGNGTSQGGSEGGGENKTESKNTESESKETKSEESETTSEESTEESSDGEGGDDDEDSNDGEESEEEDKVDKKEKKVRPPINVAANMAVMSGLDGSLSQVNSFGFAQSSLTGTTTYSANLMVWSNLQQFSLSLGESKVYFKYDREEKHYLYNPFTKQNDYIFSTYHKGSILVIESLSVNIMYMFGTKVVSFGISEVYMGQKDNVWKGAIGGFAVSGTIINIDNTAVVTPSLVAFGTKSYNVGRIVVSPMVALASNPFTYSFTFTQPGKGETVWNPHITYIVGSNFDFNLTQRFRANIGGNVIGSTLPGIPLTYGITIGSKFQF